MINMTGTGRGILWAGILAIVATVVYDLFYRNSLVLCVVFALFIVTTALSSYVLSKIRKHQKKADGDSEEGSIMKEIETTAKVVIVFSSFAIIAILAIVFFQCFLCRNVLLICMAAFVMANSIRLFLQTKRL